MPPRSRFPEGWRGGGICSGRCCTLTGPPPRPPPLPSTFSFLPEREGGASRPSPLPPTPAVPGHFCCLETFPPRGHSGPSPSWVAGGTDGLPAQDPGACLAQALHSSLIPPSGTRTGNSRRRGHPRRSRGAPSQACCGGGGDADSGPRAGSAGGCRSGAAVQCPSRAPRAAGALGEEGALQNGGAREAAAVGVLANRCLRRLRDPRNSSIVRGSSTTTLPLTHPQLANLGLRQTRVPVEA